MDEAEPFLRCEFDTEFNRNMYAEWHIPLLDTLFGDLIDQHHDLYYLTHSHRFEHNGGMMDGPCTAWPSPPSRAPVWYLIAEDIGAVRFLEVGTALGYTAALMAEAGGPRSHVDTIEIDPLHADLAEKTLGEKGLLDRVHILHGDASNILPTLTGPYDVVFVDGGDADVSRHVKRLTRPGGAPAEIKDRLRQPCIDILQRLEMSLGAGDRQADIAISEARDAYRWVVHDTLEATRQS